MTYKEENILDYGMPSPENISKYALDMYAFLRMGDAILRQIKKKNNAKTIRALVEYHNALAALFKAMSNEMGFKVNNNREYDVIKTEIQSEIATKYAPDMFRHLTLLKILLFGYLENWETKKSFKALKNLHLNILTLIVNMVQEIPSELDANKQETQEC